MAAGDAARVRPTRVLIADQERRAALALAGSLSSENDISYVGTADCVPSAYDLTRALEPDVVVIALRLGDGDGIRATEELKFRHPELRVIVLTDVFDTEIVPRAAAARASALLPDDAVTSWPRADPLAGAEPFDLRSGGALQSREVALTAGETGDVGDRRRRAQEHQVDVDMLTVGRQRAVSRYPAVSQVWEGKRGQ